MSEQEVLSTIHKAIRTTGISETARRANLNRIHLHRMRNPRFSSLVDICAAVGLELIVRPQAAVEKCKSANKEASMSNTDIRVGDWVRFYREARLVIGVVEYIRMDGVLNRKELLTNQGAINPDHIVEWRRG